MLQAIIGALCGVGLFFVLADVYRIPYLKTSKAVESLSKKQKVKTSTLNIWLGNLADFLAKHMKLNEFKKAQLEADLKTAQMDITPEKFKANAIVKALLIGIFAIPMAFIFPILSPVVLFLAVFLYRRELKSVSVRIRHKREKIESELPRLVFTIDKTLKHSRVVLYDTYLPYIVDDDYDWSYPEPETQLLCRLDDLQDRLEELIAKDAPYRDGYIYSEDDIRYALPEHLYDIGKVERAIELAKDDLVNKYGLPDLETLMIDESELVAEDRVIQMTIFEILPEELPKAA